MNRLTLSRVLGTIALSLSVSACTAPDLTGTCPVPPGTDPAKEAEILSQCFGKMDSLAVNTRTKQDVDILFVIDNSVSMSPKQKQLATAINGFINKIDATGSNYQVGVVSTDIGSQTGPGIAFQPGNQNIQLCGSYKGNDGVLWGKACSKLDQSQWSPDAKANCTSLCPTSMEPTDGKGYLWKKDGQTNAPNNDIIGTFKCIASIGDSGCGLESPLESSRRALDGHRDDKGAVINEGFLRSNSVLAVIFVTDEDDCSVALGSRTNNNPNTIDCSKNGQSTYNCWRNDFRCLANNLTCDQPLTATGGKTNCRENDNGYLDPVSKYVRFFSNLRAQSKLVLAGIWTPSILDNQTADVGKVGKLIVENDKDICSSGTCATEALNRGRGSSAACLNSTDSNFFGQAQLRLSKFIRSFDSNATKELSICEPANYVTVLDFVAERITNAISANCLSGIPKKDSAGNPVCVVGLVSSATPGAAADPESKFPVCSAKCCTAWAEAGNPSNPVAAGKTAKPLPTDPYIQAECGADPDCYCAVENKNSIYACKTDVGASALAGLWIKAAPHQTPGEKVASFKCAMATK